MKSPMNGLQSLGRALMLPIAVLPIAGLLLRLGQPDLLDVRFLSAAGDAIFSHLGILFAIGVATGYARDGNGASCLAGIVCYLVARSGGQALMHVPADVLTGLGGPVADAVGAMWKDKAIARIEVPIGILSGVAGGLLYNRFAEIRLPGYLAFFGGRRFVPIICGIVGLLIGAITGLGYDAIADGMDGLSRGIASSGTAGLFLYGLLNRLLLVTGLHHILNNIAWFVIGDFHGANGDLRRFFAGDPQAGGFMSGFFPVMMFGLPAACLAMYRTARAERRRETGGMLASLALTSLLTGVTEPIEFSFMFLAPALFAIHAVLTGLSMALMHMLGARLGFTFSAGLLDFALNYGKATRPLMLIPIGAIYGLVYYAIFHYAIVRFDLATPGREALAQPGPIPAGGTDAGQPRGGAFVDALGGPANLATIGACTTRLRLVVVDPSLINDACLKQLGAIAVLRPSPTAIQVVLGPIADLVAAEMRGAADFAGTEPVTGATEDRTIQTNLPPAIVAALGGILNIAEGEAFLRRFRFRLRDWEKFDKAQLSNAGVRHFDVNGTYLHVLLDPTPDRQGR